MAVEHIKELLFDHDCVVIPGFGGFVTSYASAQIHQVKNSFKAPSKVIAFNQSLQNSDGLLVNHIAIDQEVSHDEATQIVKDYVKSVFDQLKTDGEYQIEGIGRFFYGEEENLQFEPDQETNFLDESFGLPDLHFKPIEREDHDMKRVRPTHARPVVRRAPIKKRPSGSKESKEAKVEAKAKSKPEKVAAVVAADGSTPEKKQGSKKLFIIIPIVLLVGAAAALFVVDEGKYLEQYAGINPFFGAESSDSDDSESSDDKVASTDADELDEMDKVMSADASGSDNEGGLGSILAGNDNSESSSGSAISNGSGRYHVIGGVFQYKKNANKLVRRHGGSEILEIDGYYKVSVKKFGSKAAAESALGGLKSEYGNDIWVLEE